MFRMNQDKIFWYCRLFCLKIFSTKRQKSVVVKMSGQMITLAPREFHPSDNGNQCMAKVPREENVPGVALENVYFKKFYKNPRIVPMVILVNIYYMTTYQIHHVSYQICKGTLMQIWKSPLYILIHIKITPWKLRILSPKNYELFTSEICIFLKK